MEAGTSRTRAAGGLEPIPAVAAVEGRWTQVALLWVICLLNYADRTGIGAVFPLLEKEFSFTKTQLGSIGSSLMIAYGLISLFAGAIADRVSRKGVILGSLQVWSLLTAATSLCSQLIHFIVARVALGLSQAFYFPAAMSLVSDYHGQETRSRAMGLHQTSVYAGLIGGGAFTGWMGQHYGWRSAFVALGGAGVFLGLILVFLLRDRPRPSVKPLNLAAEPRQVGHFLRGFFRTPTSMLLLVAFVCANFVAFVFITWMPSYLYERFHLDLAAAGFGATFYLHTASLAGSILGGIAADRLRRRAAGGRIFVQAFGLLFGAVFIFACGQIRDLILLAAAMAAFGLGKGLYDSNIWASLYETVPKVHRAATVGFMNTVSWIGAALAPITFGKLLDLGVTYETAISSTAVIYLATSLLLFVGGAVFAPRDVARAAETM